MLRSVKDKVCCTPLPAAAISQRVKSGFAVAEQSLEMLGMTVVFAHPLYPVGTTIYVDGQHIASPWAKQVLKLGETSFIVVPEGQVVVFELPARPIPPPTFLR